MYGLRTTLALVIAGAAPTVWAQESVSVLESNLTRSYDCHGGNGSVNGNNNSLTFRNCAGVVVNGNYNVIDAGVVASLTTIGNGNKVSWTTSTDGRQPKIANLGTNNTISSKSAGETAAPKPAAPAGAPPQTSGTSATGASSTTITPGGVTTSNGSSTVQIGANGLTVTSPVRPAAAATQQAGGTSGASGSLSVMNNNLHQDADCSGGVALVGGNSNTLTLRNCSVITVNGNDNSVTAVGAASLVLNGNQNQIQWTENADGSRPKVVDHGNGNRVARKP